MLVNHCQIFPSWEFGKKRWIIPNNLEAPSNSKSYKNSFIQCVCVVFDGKQYKGILHFSASSIVDTSKWHGASSTIKKTVAPGLNIASQQICIKSNGSKFLLTILYESARWWGIWPSKCTKRQIWQSERYASNSFRRSWRTIKSRDEKAPNFWKSWASKVGFLNTTLNDSVRNKSNMQDEMGKKKEEILARPYRQDKPGQAGLHR